MVIELHDQDSFIYGPVPSRRLGRSLGVDIVPFKTCTLNCIYCQLGPTPQTTVARKKFVDSEKILSQLLERLKSTVEVDYITIAGSGEPTLNIELGKIIREIKKITKIPVALLTNGTLFFDRQVRAESSAADVVMPSLDAADQKTFEIINRPNVDISIEKLIAGLEAFRNEYVGRIWLEVFFVDGINTSPEHIKKFQDVIRIIRPDKVHINTVVRPPAEKNVLRVSDKSLSEIAAQIGPLAEIIACPQIPENIQAADVTDIDVLSMLERRPCTIEDISAGFSIKKEDAEKYVQYLINNKKIISEKQGAREFFRVLKEGI
jgi:wyosine [tRNA(Phe)-imidazoG37] synthetase (radical SAM superfamily)